MNRRVRNLVGAFATGVEDRVRRALLEVTPDLSFGAALVVLSQEGGLTIRRLSEALRLSHAATVRLVDRLEAGSLAKRERGRDGRSIALKLTAEGRRKVRPLLAAREKVLAEVLSALSDEDLVHLEKNLEVVLAAMTASVPEAYALCRFCDIGACDQRCCPVERVEQEIRKGQAE